MNDFDPVEWFFFVFFGFLGLAAVALVLSVACEVVQDYRSYEAQAACKKAGLVVFRRSFSTEVTCVRTGGYRTDSLNVKVIP